MKVDSLGLSGAESQVHSGAELSVSLHVKLHTPCVISCCSMHATCRTEKRNHLAIHHTVLK